MKGQVRPQQAVFDPVQDAPRCHGHKHAVGLTRSEPSHTREVAVAGCALRPSRADEDPPPAPQVVKNRSELYLAPRPQGNGPPISMRSLGAGKYRAPSNAAAPPM